MNHPTATQLFKPAIKRATNWVDPAPIEVMPVRVTLNDYTLAIYKLFYLARLNCGGSQAAAQVLLGIYNGRAWHVNLIDLAKLDPGYYRAAMIAIRGRLELNQEPHTLIDDGDAEFERLQAQWQHLNTRNRYKNF